jgi:hypothetical protein
LLQPSTRSCPPLIQIVSLVLLFLFSAALPPSCFSQANPNLRNYFKNDIGLSDAEIDSIRTGQAVAKTLHSRNADEIFVFGAVYINAPPEEYVKFSRDFNYLRSLPGYLAIEEFNNPPQLSDLKDFTLDKDDLRALKDCKSGQCQLQMPATGMESLQKSVNFSSPDADAQINDAIQRKVLERLIAYQEEGNQALGVYNDKHNPTEVPEQFKYMLSYATALPKYLPGFYNYLLSYPNGKPADTEDTFYWDKVKFGLKPTLRVVHVSTMRGQTALDPAYTIAEKQLYSSHYFQTALDLTFCIVDTPSMNSQVDVEQKSESKPSPTKPSGFYLIKAMGSEQSGLTGFKGSIVRKVAVDRSASSLQKSLTTIKSILEAKH